MKKRLQLLALLAVASIPAVLTGCTSTTAGTTPPPSRSDAGMSPGMQQKTATGANATR